jgi:AcrR family transcriptional regulator
LEKTKQIQRLAPRAPRQERSRQKVELMLEAATRILEKAGLEGLTTNAIAATAGVSIGTLYQYFSDKEAILDALADQELAAMSTRLVGVMQDASLETTQDRVAAVVRAVAATYGQRHEAHRLVMAHSLSRGGNRLAPVLARLRAHLSAERSSGAIRAALDPADAFVLTHAVSGVLRAMIGERERAPPQAEIEGSLTRLVVRYLA